MWLSVLAAGLLWWYSGPSPYAKAAPQVRPTLQKIAPSAGLAPAHRSALPPQEPKWPKSESSEATLPRLFQTGESGSEYLTIPQRELTCMRRTAFALGFRKSRISRGHIWDQRKAASPEGDSRAIRERFKGDSMFFGAIRHFSLYFRMGGVITARRFEYPH